MAIGTCGGENEDVSKHVHYYRRCIYIDGGGVIKSGHQSWIMMRRLGRRLSTNRNEAVDLEWGENALDDASHRCHIVQNMSVAAENEEERH
jgi:hypothetical protein